MRDRNGIHCNIVGKEGMKRLVESVLVLPVGAVGDQKDDFAAVTTAILEHTRRGEYGVIQGIVVLVSLRAVLRDAARGIHGLMAVHHRPGGGRIGNHLAIVRFEIEALELREQVVVVERKIGDSLGKLVVSYHGNFIGRAEAGRDGREALLNLRGWPLIEIVVDKNDGRKRHWLGGELANLLFDVIRENSKVILLKISHQLAAIIFYSNGNDHGVCWNDDPGWILLLRLRPRFARKAEQQERT